MNVPPAPVKLETVPVLEAVTVCASLVSIPVTVLCPSCTENIDTWSCAKTVPLFAPCLAFTSTFIGVSVGPGSSESASVNVDVVVFCFVVAPTMNS